MFRLWLRLTACERSIEQRLRSHLTENFDVTLPQFEVLCELDRRGVPVAMFQVCGAKGDWTPSAFIEREAEEVRKRVGKSRVLCALSGGVDSAVAAALIHKAIGDQLHCIHINTGLMRKNESEVVVGAFQKRYKIGLTYVGASKIFLGRLKSVTDPEKKRKVIGKTFIDLFEKHAGKLERESRSAHRGPFEYLAQGTLYPDVIESVSFKGPSVTIKTHHNVGGPPKRMNFRLVEPFRGTM